MPDRAPHLSYRMTKQSDTPTDVLRKRAELLSQAPQESLQATDVLEVIQFRIGRELYAIETRFVEEVIRISDITAIPDSAEILLGVMNLRGEILAVMDIGLLLHSAIEDHDRSSIMVLGEHRTEFGVTVDAVTEVTSIRVSDVHPPMKHEDQSDSLIRGVTADSLMVLDGTALLEDERLHINDI